MAGLELGVVFDVAAGEAAVVTGTTDLPLLRLSAVGLDVEVFSGGVDVGGSVLAGI